MIHKKYFFLFLALLLSFSPFMPQALAELEAGPRCFTITGYYSALPPDQQRIYSNGGRGEEAYQQELRLNGQGVRMADGTPPYIGAVAAPKTYPFGTQIRIDGVGVFTVGDRGGAIVSEGERGYKCDRLDLYTGSGEKGLAMALHLGKRTVQGEILAPGQGFEKNVDLSWLSSQLPSRLLVLIGLNSVLSSVPPPPYTAVELQLAVEPMEKIPLVEDSRPLEEKLQQLGYSGGTLEKALTEFQVDQKVIASPSDFGAGVYGPKTKEALRLALEEQKREEKQEPEVKKERPWLTAQIERLQPGLHLGAQGQSVETLQRVLWELNLYHQPVNGQYDEATQAAVYEFQKRNGVVAAHTQPGAGSYGPKTHQALQTTLEERVQVLKKYPKEAQVWLPATQALPSLKELSLPAERASVRSLNFKVDWTPKNDPLAPYRHLKGGDRGEEVVALQKLLIEKNLLEAGLATGYYGELTEAAVSNFKG